MVQDMHRRWVPKLCQDRQKNISWCEMDKILQRKLHRSSVFVWVYAHFPYIQMYICVDIGKGRVSVRARAENFRCSQICLEIICLCMQTKVQKSLITSQNQVHYHCHCKVDFKKPALNIQV